MKPTNEVQPGTTEAVRVTLTHIRALPPEQVLPYLTTIAQLSIDLLRDEGKYDEFVAEMLDAMRDSLKRAPLLTLGFKREPA
jgi:hypothetical protein